MTRLILVAALMWLAVPAQAQSADELAGIWKRPKTDSSKECYLLFEPDGDGIKATHLTPPEGMTCQIPFSLNEGRLEGTAVWKEKGWPDLETRWEFTYAGEGQFKGRVEWVTFDENDKETRGWEEHTLVRAETVGLVTSGEAEEPFGDPVDPLSSLAGGWAGPGGGWAVKVEGSVVTITPAGDHHKEASITLKDDRGILRGQALLGPGKRCRVELAFDEGKLTGRSSYTQAPELGDKSVSGWAPITFTRLERREAGPEGRAADAPTAGEGSLLGVWKRDDGLYLRVREQGGEVMGVLSDAKGQASCRLTFERENGLWIGTANWGSYETRWELAVGEEGLSGRSEWVDVHEGTVVARGWAGRSFTKLEQIH